jgi:hypothetical protein
MYRNVFLFQNFQVSLAVLGIIGFSVVVSFPFAQKEKKMPVNRKKCCTVDFSEVV